MPEQSLWRKGVRDYLTVPLSGVPVQILGGQLLGASCYD